VSAENWSTSQLQALADVAVAVKSERAGAFLNQQLAKLEFERPALVSALQHIARYAPVKELDQLGGYVKSKFSEDIDFQLALFNSVATGAEQRGVKLGDPLRSWGGELCTRALANAADSGWSNTSLENAPTQSPWAFQERRCADGRKARLLSSHPHGEALTGVLRSREFVVPGRLTFYLAGHDGPPDRSAQKNNAVRLRLAGPEAASEVSLRPEQDASVDSRSQPRIDDVLAEAYAPRNDTAQKITWDLRKHAGQRAFLEVTDADTGGAYAWIAFGRFDPPVVTLPAAAPAEISQRQQTACDLVGRLQLATFRTDLDRLVREREAETPARAAAAKALLALGSSTAIPTLADALMDAAEPAQFRVRLGELLAEQKSVEAHAAVATAMKSAPYRTQLRWAVALASSTAGADALLDAAATGAASPRLLQSIGIKNRIQAAKPDHWQERVAALTQNLPPADEARDQLITARRNAYRDAPGKAADGERIYQQNCAVCHRIGQDGALVGPQLDGIGNRGLERLLEDVLDPNRNLDSAFRSHTITLKNGDVISGLPRREEGDLLVLADSTGKEISVSKKDIEMRRESELSLMPENLGELLAPGDFNNLMAYLLSQHSARK
jgi:putative heme-binding domain-containing protein